MVKIIVGPKVSVSGKYKRVRSPDWSGETGEVVYGHGGGDVYSCVLSMSRSCLRGIIVEETILFSSSTPVIFHSGSF